tara:strand:+ start:4828 stop:5682 length:855 start_codon:yes stop_codon:yes gene_type:complete
MINNEYVNVFKNVHSSKNQNLKIIVFDLDETLGNFTDLEILWNTLLLYCDHQLTDTDFNKLLNLYPEFIRYGITPILKFVYNKKLLGECNEIFLYTNNQTSPKWVNMLINYFNHILNIKKPNKLFDQIVYAFKIKNKIIERKRTSNKKKHSDLINCTLIPQTAEICFIDDTYYNNMNNNFIYYIQPLSYQHNLTKHEIVDRLFSSSFNNYFTINQTNKHIFYNNLNANYENNKYSFNKLLDTNLIVTQKIMYYIKDFFLINNKQNITKKYNKPIKKYTRKKYKK